MERKNRSFSRFGEGGRRKGIGVPEGREGKEGGVEMSCRVYVSLGGSEGPFGKGELFHRALSLRVAR
ncbi:hypothetical protein CEXT_627731 [Caerostris extrusa]|uniref:Uncharacterized protein n=1 Tax=Caerostris extrusa TaxID=172846 RepID=A0AAV4XSZ3_CAEEX|nr:hypothetical protein CEXT_627731 [Caerostris extrusa]